MLGSCVNENVNVYINCFSLTQFELLPVGGHDVVGQDSDFFFFDKPVNHTIYAEINRENFAQYHNNKVLKKAQK